MGGRGNPPPGGGIKDIPEPGGGIIPGIGGRDIPHLLLEHLLVVFLVVISVELPAG